MDSVFDLDRLSKVLQDSPATKWTVTCLVAGLTIIGSWYGVERLQSKARLQNGERYVSGTETSSTSLTSTQRLIQNLR